MGVPLLWVAFDSDSDSVSSAATSSTSGDASGDASDSISWAAASSTSGDAYDSVSSSAAASSTSGDSSDSFSSEATSLTVGSLQLYDDSICDCGELDLSRMAALIFGVDAEFADDSGYLGYQEPLSLLAAEYESGNIIELLQDKYSRFRRAKEDENSFYRSFMFAYLEHLLETQDKAQIDSALEQNEQCMNALTFGESDCKAYDYFLVFHSLLQWIQEGTLSHDELLRKSNNIHVSEFFVCFLKIATSVELRAKAEFYNPLFITEFGNLKLEKLCDSSVDQRMVESDQLRVKALTDALGVQLRIEYAVQSSNDSITPQLQQHEFQPSATAAADRLPSITLLYRPGHYYILYP